MTILAECADVKTAYGGGFVTAINGIKAGKGCDWFYYVNGAMPNVGALSYIPCAGDIVWWDFHEWQGARPVPAVIGSFPRPFTAPPCRKATEIVYSEHLKEKAAQLRDLLVSSGASAVRIQPLSRGGISYQSPILFLGPWDALKGNPEIKGLYTHARKCGFFVSFGEEGLRTLAVNGAARSLFRRAGAILALKKGFSNDAPIWLVTGTDREYTILAADVLIKEPGKIKGMAGAVVTKEDIHPVPLSVNAGP